MNELFEAMKGIEELNDDEINHPELYDDRGLLPLKAHGTQSQGHVVRALQGACMNFGLYLTDINILNIFFFPWAPLFSFYYQYYT